MKKKKDVSLVIIMIARVETVKEEPERGEQDSVKHLTEISLFLRRLARLCCRKFYRNAVAELLANDMPTLEYIVNLVSSINLPF